MVFTCRLHILLQWLHKRYTHPLAWKVVFKYSTWSLLSAVLTHAELPSCEVISSLSIDWGRGKFRPWSLCCSACRRLSCFWHESELIGCMRWRASENTFDTHCWIYRRLATHLGRNQILHHVWEEEVVWNYLFNDPVLDLCLLILDAWKTDVSF